MPNPSEALLPPDAVLVPGGLTALTIERLQLDRRESVAPWTAARIEVLADLSRSLLAHDLLRRDPAAVALGFWLRPANQKELKMSFPVENGVTRVPAGLVMHITPANVDTMFVYSWALSFLSGNANVVRLTTQPSPLLERLVNLLADVFGRHREATKGNYFVKYGHDDAVTASLSSICDLRIVWGGDETVRRLRAIPLNPHAGERSFASKRSMAVIKTSAYVSLPEAARQKVAEQVASDLIPFAQMACSSPHQVFWIGKEDEGNVAIEDFGQRLDAVMSMKAPGPDLAASVRRINAAFSAAASGQAERVALGRHSSALVATSPADTEQRDPCGAGLLYHTSCLSLAQVGGLLRPDHQTITYFGLSEHERSDLAMLAGVAGVDRIVPCGRALEFSPVWDGYSLWHDLTRGVVVR